MSLLFGFMSLLPKSAVSYVVGWLSRLRLPRPFSTWLCRAFALVFRLDMKEAALPITAFACIEDVFVRRLKDGMRPIAGPVCSPADGFLSVSLPAAANCAVQAKGIEYDLSELVFGDAAEEAPDFGHYLTVYLAPHNYHRVHSPVAGVAKQLRYFPGELWPVNKPFVKLVPNLFVRNERLVFDIHLDGGGVVYVVMVGALNVGRMVTPLCPELVTNSFKNLPKMVPEPRQVSVDAPVAAGSELGTFMLGSTAVVVFDKAASAKFQFVQLPENDPILMGSSLASGK